MGASMHVEPDPRQVFVVHGRDTAARGALFAFLRSIGLEPIEWAKAVQMSGEATPHIGTILNTAFEAASAVVVLLTPDEIVHLRGELSGNDEVDARPASQARPNVLFEAGIAMGRDEKRTVLVELGKVRPFSDVAGRYIVRLDNSHEKRKELAQRLETTGCSVDLSGQDWLSAGDFTMQVRQRKASPNRGERLRKLRRHPWKAIVAGKHQVNLDSPGLAAAGAPD